MFPRSCPATLFKIATSLPSTLPPLPSPLPRFYFSLWHSLPPGTLKYNKIMNSKFPPSKSHGQRLLFYCCSVLETRTIPDTWGTQQVSVSDEWLHLPEASTKCSCPFGCNSSFTEGKAPVEAVPALWVPPTPDGVGLCDQQGTADVKICP